MPATLTSWTTFAEKEALALIWALQNFEVYVGGGKSLVVYADHNTFTFFHSLQNPNQQLMRCCFFLQPFNIEIRNIKGSANVVADALSCVLPHVFEGFFLPFYSELLLSPCFCRYQSCWVGLGWVTGLASELGCGGKRWQLLKCCWHIWYCWCSALEAPSGPHFYGWEGRSKPPPHALFYYF